MKRLDWSTRVAIAPILLSALQAFAPIPALAQISTAPDGTNSIVTPTGSTFNITGGTQAGSNLFHSFQQFGLNQGQIASFLSNPTIQNILGRVTGGEASVINGLIQVTGSNANLYLMNPAGIVFGANASLNVPGSFSATTANGIGIGTGWFNAAGNNNYAALIGDPNQFAFSTLQPGAIINAGNLAVGQGQNITLLGGTVVNTGTLTAPGGAVTVAAVPGENLVRVRQVGSLLTLEFMPLAPSNRPNPVLVNPVSLPQLLTGGNVGNATGLSIENNVVRLTGSGITVSSGDVVAKNIEAQTATLSATNNLTLPESRLQTASDLNLQAGNVVTVRDSVAHPVTIQAGGSLTLQGDRGIDILALNHPQPALRSGGNLQLISDGVISGDAHYAAGGSFSMRNLAGGMGHFVSFYDPIISANGDVTFGNYTGVSLKVEATGNITTGNIEINNPDATFAGAPAGTDRQILGTTWAVILRAGVPILEETTFAANLFPNPPFSFNSQGTTFNGSSASSPTGRVTVGTPVQAGVPSIQAEYIDISAPNGILINGPAIAARMVKLTSTAGDILVHSIAAGGQAPDNTQLIPGGNFVQVPGTIDITAGGIFRATGTLDTLDPDYVGYTIPLRNYTLVDPNLVPFLVNQTGNTEAEVTTAIQNSDLTTVLATANPPTSIHTFLGSITIRYGGGGTSVTLAPNVTVDAAKVPFNLGPGTPTVTGAAYVPTNPADNFATFVQTPFSVTKNETYALATIPPGESGTAGAITRTTEINGSLTVAVQNQVIGVPPTVIPDPQVPIQPVPNQPPQTPTQNTPQVQASDSGVSSTVQQTVQRTFVSSDQTSACKPTGTPIASAGETGQRSANAASTPCTSASDDAQILKILGVDTKPNQSNRLIQPSIELAVLQILKGR